MGVAGPPVRWAILGAGRIAHAFAGDIALVPEARLQAVAAREFGRARAFADQYRAPDAFGDYDSMLASGDVDAVYIATPHSFHFEQTRAALRAGKAVLCEKPLTVTPQETRILIEEASTAGVFLAEAMWTWTLPAIQRAAAWIKDGRIGEVRQIDARFGFTAKRDREGRLFNPALAGGALLDLGVYPVALNRLVLGRGPDTVRALAGKAETGVEDQVEAIFQTGPVLTSLGCSFLGQLSNTAFIAGDRGAIRIPRFWSTTEAELIQGGTVVEHFEDGREGHGFEFEIAAATHDILAGRTVSSVVPLAASLGFQEDMDMIRAAAGLQPPIV